MLQQCFNHSKQCRNNVTKLCYAKNRRCELSRVTSPYTYCFRDVSVALAVAVAVAVAVEHE